jgi:hypothetical protein
MKVQDEVEGNPTVTARDAALKLKLSSSSREGAGEAARSLASVRLVSFECDLDPLRLAAKHASHFPHLRHSAPNRLLAGLQTISPSYYEASALDGATPWQQFRNVTLPLLTPIIAVVMTFSVLFTFTDFQLIYVLTRGGPLNSTHLMATLAFQRGISGGAIGEGAAIATAMVPFLLGAIMFSYFGLQRRAWQQGGDK